MMTRLFRVARNPDAESRLPYLVWLPLDGGLVLKAREAWPRAARVFCSQDGTPWDERAGLVDEAEVVLCRRRGAAIDLVLDRPQLARSQFVFTQARGRPAVWWQTQKTVQAANPGARVPRGRAAAIVVEGDYPDLFRTQPGRGSWLADMLGRLAVRYPEVPVVFAGSRRFAEEWTYRFFGALVGDVAGIAEGTASGTGPRSRRR
jgi:hypothetical protein